MVRQIFIPVVLSPRMRHLWSENGKNNDIEYRYCADLCLSAHVHCGHDVEAVFEPIFAATDGVVKFSGGRDGFYTPNHVDIEPIVGPFRGEYHIYGHLSEAWVAGGSIVRKGQQIGVTGTNCTDSTCRQLAIGNEHLHWERRGTNGCSLDPDPVLTSQDANGGPSPNGGPVASEFARQDTIRVADGPLRLRDGPGSGFGIRQELPLGAQMCVTGEPHDAEGHTWYPVRLPNLNLPGWVAGAFCALVTSGGCGGEEGVAMPPPQGAAQPGQPIGAHPDSGPPADIAESPAAAMPMVEYDAEGVFVGVTFPTPAPQPESPQAPGRGTTPFAKG
jgi:hypothetical protein